MKRLYFVLFLFGLSLSALAQNQQVIVKGFTKADIGDMRARTSPVFDNNRKLTALVEVSLPLADSTVQFEGVVGVPEKRLGNWYIRIAEGTTSIKMAVPGCETIAYSFPEAIESGRVYKLNMEVRNLLKLRTLILPVFSYNPAQISYGAMVGFCKRHGAYIKAKTNFQFGLQPSFECDDQGMIDGVKGWFSGESKTSRYSFSGGYLGQLFQSRKNLALYAYAGAGYGQRILGWQVRGTDGEFEYARVTSSSYSGVEAELGLVFRMGGFAIMAGAQTIMFKYYEANVGIGVMF